MFQEVDGFSEICHYMIFMSKSQLISLQSMSMMSSVNISIQKSGSCLVKCFPDLPPTFPDSWGYHYGCDFCMFRLSATGEKQKNPQLPGIFQTHEHEASMKILLSLLAITLNLGSTMQIGYR